MSRAFAKYRLGVQRARPGHIVVGHTNQIPLGPSSISLKTVPRQRAVCRGVRLDGHDHLTFPRLAAVRPLDHERFVSIELLQRLWRLGVWRAGTPQATRRRERFGEMFGGSCA